MKNIKTLHEKIKEIRKIRLRIYERVQSSPGNIFYFKELQRIDEILAILEDK